MLFRTILIMCAWWYPALCVEVNTQYGPVRGETVDVDNGRDVVTVDVFRAIPFGKDTSGAGRFLRPEAPDPWVQVRDALEPGPACPQGVAFLNRTNPNWNQISEDCLHVDIYTPNALAAPDSYAVMIYMYGGGYQIGANIQYPGHFLARHGVVVAVVNYRIREFGFAFTGNAAAPGNAGLWDQQMGIQFVIDNIRNFGGDPNRITVFGESAGGSSTALLIVSPQTKDLFQQAICQSGTESNLWSWNRAESNPENYTRQMAENFGCLGGDDFQMMDCLRQVSMEDILENSTMRCSPGFICLGMAPVIDGPGGFLPKDPSELREDGDIMQGSLMSGITQDEGSMFTAAFVPGTLYGCCNRSRFEELLRERIVGYFEPRFDGKTMDDAYEAINWHYSYWPYLYENEANRDSFVRLLTDAAFGVPWDKQIKHHSKIADTYSYVFDYMSINSSTPSWQGTPHGGDVPYVWGTPLLQYNAHIREACYLHAGNYNDDDVAYSLYIQELFTNFVKFGDPTFFDVQKPSGGVTVWPKFDETDYSTFYLSNNAIDPVLEYRQRNYAFWYDYMRYIGFGLVSGEEPQDTSDLFDVLAGMVPTPLYQLHMFNSDEVDEMESYY